MRYEMDQRRHIDISTAFKGPFKTTPIVKRVTPYKPPKKGPLLLKDDDGRTVDLGVYTVYITPFPWVLYSALQSSFSSSFSFPTFLSFHTSLPFQKPGKSCGYGQKNIGTFRERGDRKANMNRVRSTASRRMRMGSFTSLMGRRRRRRKSRKRKRVGIMMLFL